MKPRYGMTYINIVTTVLCAVVIFAGILWSLLLMRDTDVRHYDNQVRVQLSDQIRLLEEGRYESCAFSYIVFGLDGTVEYADAAFQQKVGSVVNVQEMIRMDEYSVKAYGGLYKEVSVLEDGDEVKGFAVFLIPEELMLKAPVYEQILMNLIPLGVSILLLLFIMIGKMLYYHIKVLNPIREISKSANHIINGNYDYEVVRVNGTDVRNDELGDLIYSFELMRDELKEKQLREEQLKKSQQELISCISHDLKTPISTIKAYGEGLRDGIAATEEVRKEYEEVIINKTNLLSQMISELLEYSNAQLNQLEIVPREVYFLSYFEETAKELQRYARQRGVVLTYRTDLPDMIVTIDNRRVTEVLYNLVENSIKYIGDQQGRIELTAVRQDQGVLIRVIDNGIGISADDIPYVFDRFYRAEKSRTSSIPGSGLGLSICKYIIEALGGTIYCKSGVQGKGCEIGFTIH
ncbi:MAG: HAMP domain-containing sensor histidine kinase [bacterium]|nr:HAMP domain-containing sensor histidine kinase [bacterium]